MATDVKLSSEFTIIYGGEVIAYATDFTLERNKEIVDITKLGDTWKNKKTVLKDFSISFNAMITRGDTVTASLWSVSTAYSAGDYVVLAGNAYEAQGSTTGDNPTTDDGTNWLETSDYASGTTYAAGDMVYYQTVEEEKRIYISLVGSNLGNNPPDSATQWERLETNYESLLNELKSNDTAVKCTIKPTAAGETYYYGDGVITSLSASIGVADKATFSGTFEGTGELSTSEGFILDDGNTVAWFDMDSSYITKDGSDLISQWSDRSGNANHLLQATGADQPLWSSTGVLFDGVSEFMKAAAFALVQPEMIYIVFKHVTWTVNDRLFDGDSATSGMIYQSAVSGELKAHAGTASPILSLALDTFTIARVLFNGASSTFQLDVGTVRNGDFGSNDMGGFTLGSSGTGAISWSNIEVKEVILRDIIDSSEDQTTIYDYLVDKYSL